MVLKKAPKANKSKCIGCGACVAQCPAKAIEIKNGKAVIDPKKCEKCGTCIEVCPVQAISE